MRASAYYFDFNTSTRKEEDFVYKLYPYTHV